MSPSGPQVIGIEAAGVAQKLLLRPVSTSQYRTQGGRERDEGDIGRSEAWSQSVEIYMSGTKTKIDCDLETELAWCAPDYKMQVRDAN